MSNFFEQLQDVPPAKNLPFPDALDSTHFRLNYVLTHPGEDNSYILSANGRMRIVQYRADYQALYVYRTTFDQGVHLYLKNNIRKLKYPEVEEVTDGRGQKLEVMIYKDINSALANGVVTALRTILTGVDQKGIAGHHTADVQVFWGGERLPDTKHPRGILWRFDNTNADFGVLSYTPISHGVAGSTVSVAHFTPEKIVIWNRESLTRATKELINENHNHIDHASGNYTSTITFKMSGNSKENLTSFITKYTNGIMIDEDRYWTNGYLFIFQGSESYTA